MTEGRAPEHLTQDDRPAAPAVGKREWMTPRLETVSMKDAMADLAAPGSDGEDNYGS